MTLDELSTQLRRFADGELDLTALRRAFEPSLDADPLDVARSDARPWADAPDDARLAWRLIHLFDSAPPADEAVLRRLAGRLLRSVADAGSATTHELLRVIADQDRFCEILRRHHAGVISRTGFLSVVAESRYPPHVKLWLRHAGPAALARLCARLEAGEYAAVAGMVEREPEE
jgi:hypothetical protein